MADMILPQPKDAPHKAWLYRILMEMYEDAFLAAHMYFKGGTAAAMFGWLDRFSVDLDFDFVGPEEDMPESRMRLERAFDRLGLRIGDQSKAVPQYFVKYEAPEGQRNTIKIDTTFPPPKANRYEPKRFHEIDRIITCQTVETMMANKLVALQDRYLRHEAIAGRDLYDIHHFFFRGFRYNEEVIEERMGKEMPRFFSDLIAFIEQHITDDVLSQDLNTLLPYEKFRRIRKVVKQETILFLQDELRRLHAVENSPDFPKAS